MAHMDTKHMPLAADQHLRQPPGPHHPSPYSSRPPSMPHSSQKLPPVSTLQHHHQHPPPPPPVHFVAPPPPLGPYQQPPPPPQPSHSEVHERVDHGYNGPHSGHATPVTRHQTEGPYQRPPSTPTQGQPLPQERAAMDAAPGTYLPPLPHHSEQHHPVAYTPLHQPGPPMLDSHYGPPHAGYVQPYSGPLYPAMHMSNSNARKKSMRASQACDKCRERKSKCDEQRPCSTCKDQAIECHYKDNQPTKTDKNNAALAESIDKVLDYLSALDERLGRIEETVGPHNYTNKVESTSHQGSRNDTPVPSQDQLKQETDRASVEKSSDFAEHSTAAHKLIFLWPSIAPLLAKTKMPVSTNYVIKEEDRGPLRLYGRGEKTFHDSVAIGAASPAHSSGSDDFGASPLDGSGSFELEARRSEPLSESVLNMDAATLHNLFDKYKRHIHRLHPFLDIDAIGKYVKVFIQRHGSDTKYSHSPLFAANGAGEMHRNNLKRKRSEPGSAQPYVQKRQPERNVKNAIVFLVFALGKICEAKDPIPGPTPDIPALQSSSIALAFPSASPMMKQSPSSPQSSVIGMTPPAVSGSKGGMDSYGSSFDGSPNVEKTYGQNVDKIPGLVYYREACSILGDFTDSNELACAQARLLAGLYKGQLGRVQESWSWIRHASTTCQYRNVLDDLIHCKDNGKEIDKKTNLALLAYWTCLQLETDILAELDYPHSGIGRYEAAMPYPNIVQDEEAERSGTGELGLINIYYTAQLFLRKRLNDMHARIYGVEVSKQDPEKLAEKLIEHDGTLRDWRNLRGSTQWDDHEPPQSDILVARLRGKYYGARYVATRPFLDYALHVMDEVKNGAKLDDVTVDAKGKQRPDVLALFRAIQSMTEETIKEKVQICIQSAMKSTIAFDGVIAKEQRLIVTNIMGTAHAQFGNMLVLAATYKSNKQWLKDLVPRKQLYDLLRRTIKFLRQLAAASSSVRVDIGILETLDQALFPHEVYENEVHTGDSFSS